MRKQLINPPQLHDGRPFGMSQAVIDTASATVYISGQIDWDVNNLEGIERDWFEIQVERSKILALVSRIAPDFALSFINRKD